MTSFKVGQKAKLKDWNHIYTSITNYSKFRSWIQQYINDDALIKKFSKTAYYDSDDLKLLPGKTVEIVVPKMKNPESNNVIVLGYIGELGRFIFVSPEALVVEPVESCSFCKREKDAGCKCWWCGNL